MSSTLRDFASAAVQSKRIRFGDLRRLKRDILPARITTREEAEVLIALELRAGVRVGLRVAHLLEPQLGVREGHAVAPPSRPWSAWKSGIVTLTLTSEGLASIRAPFFH
jgi:hypothetical protein